MQQCLTANSNLFFEVELHTFASSAASLDAVCMVFFLSGAQDAVPYFFQILLRHAYFFLTGQHCYATCSIGLVSCQE